MAGSNSSFSGFGDLFAGIFGKNSAESHVREKGIIDSWKATQLDPGLRPDTWTAQPEYFDFNWDPDGVYGDTQKTATRDVVFSMPATDDQGNPIPGAASQTAGGPNAGKQAQIDALRRYENRVINPQVQQQLLDASMGKAPGQDLLSAAARGDTDSQRLLSDAAHGRTPSQAELMLQREGGRIANQAMSQARSAREYNPALERAAMDSGVAARADAANQAAIMRAGEMANARSAYDASMSAGRGAYDASLAGGRANAASYTLGQQGANDQMTSLLRQQDFARARAQQEGGMAYNQAGQNSINAKNAARLGVAATMRADRSVEDNYDLNRGNLISGYAALTGKGLGGLADSGMDYMERMFTMGGGGSDERMKKDIKPLASQDVNDMLDNLVPSTYKYKNPDMPWTRPGPQAGVMAQDLEKSPMGASMVRDTPVGKIVDTNAAIGALLAANADLHKRLKKIEGQDIEIGQARIDSKGLKPTGEHHPMTGRPQVEIGKAQIDPYQVEIGPAEINPEFTTPDGGTIVRNIGPAFQMGPQDPNNRARTLELMGAGKARRAKYGI